MKKHLSLLFLFLLTAVVELSAKTIDTKDLTVTAPDTWIAESSDVGYPISSLVTMSNASETEMLVIGVYEVDVDLQSFLQQQVVEGSNNFFTNASYVGEIRDEKEARRRRLSSFRPMCSECHTAALPMRRRQVWACASLSMPTRPEPLRHPSRFCRL